MRYYNLLVERALALRNRTGDVPVESTSDPFKQLLYRDQLEGGVNLLQTVMMRAEARSRQVSGCGDVVGEKLHIGNTFTWELKPVENTAR